MATVFAVVLLALGPRRVTVCRKLATIDNGVGLDNDEQGLPLLLCRPSEAWSALWPHLTHFN